MLYIFNFFQVRLNTRVHAPCHVLLVGQDQGSHRVFRDTLPRYVNPQIFPYQHPHSIIPCTGTRTANTLNTYTIPKAILSARPSSRPTCTPNPYPPNYNTEFTLYSYAQLQGTLSTTPFPGATILPEPVKALTTLMTYHQWRQWVWISRRDTLYSNAKNGKVGRSRR